jgi:isocitrate dehydrogenase kinase/phosphatase
VVEYACINWPHHIFLGFQREELNVDETITTSLVTLIENLLTSQSKTWYNTMLTVGLPKNSRTSRCAKDLFQVSHCNSQIVITLLTCVRHCRA